MEISPRSACRAGTLAALLLTASHAAAHDVSPLALTLTAGGTGTFTVSDTACRAVITAASQGPTIATVSPAGPVTAFTQLFTVQALRAGTTSILVTWSGISPCVDNGSRAVSVTVTPAAGPVVLSPSSGAPGQVLPVTVVTPFLSDLGTIAFEPAGYLAASSLVDTSGSLRFTLSIAANAPPGPYTFVYSPPGGGTPIRQPAAFQVTGGPSPGPGGTLQVAPDTIAEGTSGVRLVVAGSGFGSATFVTGPADVRVDRVSVLSPDRLELVVSNALGTPSGPRAFTVTTGSTIGQVVVTVVPATALSAPVSVQTAAIVWPRPGMLLAPGDVVLARGILGTTGTGAILGSWQLDGFPYERFAVTVTGGDPVTLESQVPVPVTGEGDHDLRLVIDTPQEFSSENVRLLGVTRSLPSLRLLAPEEGAAGGDPPLFRWTLLPGAQAYVVGFRAGADDPDVLEYRTPENEWRPTAEEWRALSATRWWAVRPVFPPEVRGTPTPWRRLSAASVSNRRAGPGVALAAQTQGGQAPPPTPQPAFPAASAPGNWMLDTAAMGTFVDTSPEIPAPSTARLTVASSGSWKGEEWSADEAIAMGAHRELESPNRTLLDGRNFVARGGVARGEWGARGTVSYSAPAANDQLQLLSTGLARGGVELAAMTPAGRISGYETFDGRAPGAASTVSGQDQRIRFAAYDAPLPAERFALRAVYLDVEDSGSPDGLVPATHRRAWGALGRYTVSPALGITLEAAHGTHDVDTGAGDSGNAFRIGLSGALGATRYAVNFHRVDGAFVNPASRGLTVASQDRTSGDVTLSRSFGKLAAAVLYRYYESGPGTTAPKGHQHSGGLTLALPISSKVSIAGTGTLTQDRADAGAGALGALPGADRGQAGFRLSASETLGALALSESFGYAKLTDRRAATNDTATTMASLSAAGALAPWLSLTAMANVTRLDAVLAGRTETLLLFVQPAIAVVRDRLMVVPRAGYTRTELGPAETLTQSERYLANAQWFPWGTRGFAAVGATAEWDRNRTPVPGAPQGFLHRYSGTVAIRWGASSRREPFAPNAVLPPERPEVVAMGGSPRR